MKRIDHVYNFYSDPELLEQASQRDTKYRPYLTNIVTALDKFLERVELQVLKKRNLRRLPLD